MEPPLTHSQEDEEELDFGILLKLLRTSKRVKQGTIAALLADKGWTATAYTRLENGDIAPRFADLLPIYRAFLLAGVTFSLADRQQFVDRARTKIERKKTHREQHSDAEWAELRYELTRLDGLPEIVPLVSSSATLPRKPLLADIDHLIGREDWREQMLSCFQGSARVKVLVIQGPAGIGKSSELNWLATYFFQHQPAMQRVLLCDLRSLSGMSRPEDAFHVFAATFLSDLGGTQPQPPFLSLDEQVRRLVEYLEQARLPVVVCLDHAECLLLPSGELAPCWERFLVAFLRSQHSATLALTSQQWPGWYQGERQFVAEYVLPPLSRDKSLLLLQQQGLDRVPVTLLERVYEQVGGLPLALEWVAALVKRPLEVEDWEAFAERDQQAEQPPAPDESLTDAIERLLAEPHIFGGSLADDVAPLLERIIATQHLSSEARRLLEILSVATIPLARPALQLLCPDGPRPIKELRRASVLVSYPDRIQLLPTVAAAMYRHLTAEQRKERETTLIEACKAWVKQGTLHEQEQAAVVTELATLLLKHHRLLEAAEHLIYYGWLSFNEGHGPQLAHLTEQMMQQCNWQETLETECAGLLLQQLLFRFLGRNVDDIWYANYERLRDAVLIGKVELPLGSDYYLTHLLIMYAINRSRFEEAQTLLDAYSSRLTTHQMSDRGRQMAVLDEQARLFAKWSEYADQQKDRQKAKELRERAIALYQEYCRHLLAEDGSSALRNSLNKKNLSHTLNDIGYYLNRNGRFEEALKALEQSIALGEQGYTFIGLLSTSYDEKSQALMGLGRFQEALQFHEKAWTGIQSYADKGDASASDETWMYLINRGRLYLRLGRIEEAEPLLREAPQHLRLERSMYRMFAEDALDEIERWRKSATTSHYQLDWRWVERYRELVAYDSHSWLAYAGPFTEDEQQQWEELFKPPLDAARKEQVGIFLTCTRDRELTTALTEQREPRFHYPAVEIDDVRRRIADLQQLGAEISQQEPNAIVRRLYHGAIEEEVDYLRVIEASYEGDTDKYWLHLTRILPPPTPEEMDEALDHIKRMVIQGLHHSHTAKVSQQFRDFLLAQLHISIDLPLNAEDVLEIAPSSSSQPEHIVNAQTAKRFFEAALQEGGYDNWQVVIDPAAVRPRIEQGLRQFILPDERFYLRQIRNWLTHEIAGHVARCVAGERSLLGLLGIHTKNSLPTEEGFAQYHEQQVAALHGQSIDEAGYWLGTLVTGIASGVMTPPQTFFSLYTFLTFFSTLRQLLRRPDADIQEVEEAAQRHALSLCLRAYIGVPDLTRAGVCYSQDAVYLRGIRMIERAVAEDKTVLDRLAVGVVALELLPDLQELGIVSAPHPLMAMAYDLDLDNRILSFEVAEEQAHSSISKERR